MVEGCKYLGGRFCPGGRCILRDQIESQSRSGGSGPGGTGPQWSEGGWQGFGQQTHDIATGSGCGDPGAVDQHFAQETQRKRQRGELS